MKAIHALAELDKLGSASDPVIYPPFHRPEGDEEVQVDEVVHTRGVGDLEAHHVRFSYWGLDRQGKFRLIKNGSLSGMLGNRREHRYKQQRREGRTHCPACHRAYPRLFPEPRAFN